MILSYEYEYKQTQNQGQSASAASYAAQCICFLPDAGSSSASPSSYPAGQLVVRKQMQNSGKLAQKTHAGVQTLNMTSDGTIPSAFYSIKTGE